MAYQPDYLLLTAEQFLEIDFGEQKAELDRGAIRIMSGGTARHVRVQGNILSALATKLRGTGCSPYTSVMAVRTLDISIRYPDVTVYCGRGGKQHDDAKAFDDPRAIFEVHSAGTARSDLSIKLDEYKALASVDTIVFVDIATERLRVVQRTGPKGWTDQAYDAPADIAFPSLAVDLAHDDIFARD